MAKKFGKFLLCTAAIGTAVAAAYYAASSHSYVPLKNEGKTADSPEATVSDGADSSEKEGEGFVPLAEHAAQAADTLEKAADTAEATVEEFFDEDDTPDEEPPISDN